MKHSIFLAIGITITIAFYALSYSTGANVFEMLYFNQGFNDQLFNLQMYPVMAAIIALMAWGGAAVYYYVINSVKFDRWYHWASALAVCTLLAPIACYAYIDNKFAHAGLLYIDESIHFVTQILFIEALLFIVASFSIRWWSSNCRHTPFPQ